MPAVSVTVSLQLDPSAVRAVVGGQTTDAVNRAAEVTAKRAKANILKAGRVDTGQMLSKVKVVKQASPSMEPNAQVVVDVPYAMFQERGTKAHGPTRGRFLVFVPKGGQKFVFAKWVRGVTPAWFMRDAIGALRVSDFER